MYGLGQVLSIESEGAGKDLQIVEVFHAAVGDPKFNHRFKFFGDDRLSGIVKLVFTCAKMNRKEQQ